MTRRDKTGRLSSGSVHRHEPALAYSFLMPLMAIFCLFMVSPLFTGVKLGLTEENGNWSLRNIALLLTERRFYINLRLTLFFVVVTVAAAISTGLLAAHLITRRTVFISIIRPLYLIPWIIPPSASGILFRALLDGGRGPIPNLLKVITNHSILPLADPKLSIWACILHEYWRTFPFSMLFIAAGMTTIPREIYEAATIDGASRWKQFTSMTLPMLRNHLFIVTLMVTNATLQSSESIYALTKGGPGYSTETIAVRMFKSAFVYNELHTGAAFGILLLLIAIVFIVLYRKVMNMEEG
jgi:multiple sugar transport system permease protein